VSLPRHTLDRLLELGPVSELLERAPQEAADALDLDRVLLSRVEDGLLVPESLYVRGSPEAAASDLEQLRHGPVKLDYPLVEGEVLRRRRPQLVHETDPPGRRAYAEVMGWRDYLTAPIVLDTRVIGFFHADRLPSGRPLDRSEEEALGTFALFFVLVFERAVLRRRLRVQHQEMRQVASWADARTSELSDGAITLVPDGGTGEADETARAAPSEGALRDLLTRRELDVLELMVKGETNAAIARNLVVSQGTVKFHVKNILRKLHASNRAEATSRYLRLTLGRGEVPGSGGESAALR
jgi:LuxR family transcriptional regulator, regulator of acetate metabolism